MKAICPLPPIQPVFASASRRAVTSVIETAVETGVAVVSGEATFLVSEEPDVEDGVVPNDGSSSTELDEPSPLDTSSDCPLDGVVSTVSGELELDVGGFAAPPLLEQADTIRDMAMVNDNSDVRNARFDFIMRTTFFTSRDKKLFTHIDGNTW